MIEFTRHLQEHALMTMRTWEKFSSGDKYSKGYAAAMADLYADLPILLNEWLAENK